MKREMMHPDKHDVAKRICWYKEMVLIQRDQQRSIFGRFSSNHRLGSFALAMVFDNANPTTIESATDTISGSVNQGQARTHISSSSDDLVGSSESHFRRTCPTKIHLLGEIAALPGLATR